MDDATVRTYSCRAEARAAIEPALEENRVIFEEYGPENDYRFDPESEGPALWRHKLLTRVFPNNRKILDILDVNRMLLRADERVQLELFRRHIDDIERRHVSHVRGTGGKRFPSGISKVLT